MNRLERKMLDTLKKLGDSFGVVAIKAEFEAEGTRPDEFLRLLELTQRANLKTALKIGGCEAVTDLLSTRIYGVDHVVAPMVETPYALSKFIEAKNKVHGPDGERTEFLFNLETQTTLENLDKMVALAKGNVDGIVFGRVDFTLSRGLPRGAVNEREITDAVLTVAHACRDHDLDLVVGGSVSQDAVEALREVRRVRLDRFETRKIIFDGSAVETDAINEGIAHAVDFELMWLQNKRDYYTSIASEDDARIAMMEKRQAAQRAG